MPGGKSDVDRSLWFLTRLRVGAAFRRWKRSLARPKGILATVALALLFAPSFVGAIILFFVPLPIRPTAAIERFGPIGLCVVTILTLATSTGSAALYFAPAEVDFLFSGPYRRRQLVAYRLTLVLIGSVTFGLFFGTIGKVNSPLFVSAFLGSMLVVLFYQLAQMVLGLTISLIGALAWSRARRWGLLAVLAGLVLAVAPSRASLLDRDWLVVARSVEASPVTVAVLTPFRWFVLTYTAPDLPHLIRSGSLALLVDLGLAGLVFALDAGYLEASSLASARRLATARKMVKGGGAIKLSGTRKGQTRVSISDPPWWGGVGPNLWRQLLSALGNPTSLVVFVLLAAGLGTFFGSVLPRREGLGEALRVTLPMLLGVGLPMLTVLLSSLLAFDFRGDLDVMETLKMLPIAPGRLVLGQVLTPTLLATVIQGAGILGFLAGIGGARGHYHEVVGGLSFLVPANLYFFAVENLLFLWYPARIVVGQFNGMLAVREILLLLAKWLAVSVAALVVGGVGVGVFFALGRQTIPALVVAWLTLLGLAVALLPLLGRAFTRFDLSADTPA